MCATAAAAVVTSSRQALPRLHAHTPSSDKQSCDRDKPERGLNASPAVTMIANWDPARASAQHGSILVAKHDFSPRSEDELSLKQGDKIKLEERDEDFNDGWFLGINLRTGIKGLFPESESNHKHCLCCSPA